MNTQDINVLEIHWNVPSIFLYVLLDASLLSHLFSSLNVPFFLWRPFLPFLYLVTCEQSCDEGCRLGWSHLANRCSHSNSAKHKLWTCFFIYKMQITTAPKHTELFQGLIETKPIKYFIGTELGIQQTLNKR